MNIFQKEFMALYKTISALKYGSRALALSDNTGVVAAFRKGRTLDSVGMGYLKKIQACILQRNLMVRVSWISTTKMAEDGADAASRAKFRQPDLYLGDKGLRRLEAFLEEVNLRGVVDIFGSTG